MDNIVFTLRQYCSVLNNILDEKKQVLSPIPQGYVDNTSETDGAKSKISLKQFFVRAVKIKCNCFCTLVLRGLKFAQL